MGIKSSANVDATTGKLTNYTSGKDAGLETGASLAGVGYLWLDANQITGLNDGDPINTEWTDATGNGRTFVQGTGSKQPTYKTGILNSLPVVRFDGSADNLSQTLEVLDGSNAFEMMFVAKSDQANTTQYLLDNYLGTNSRLRVLILASGGNTHLDLLIGDGTTTYNAGNAGDTAVGVGWRLMHFRCSTDTNGVTTVLDKVEQTTTRSTFANTIDTNNSTTALGSLRTEGGSFFDGDMAEVIIYSSKFTDYQKETMENYLDSKYALGL